MSWICLFCFPPPGLAGSLLQFSASLAVSLGSSDYSGQRAITGDNVHHFLAKVMKSPLCSFAVLSSPAEATLKVISKMEHIGSLNHHLEESYSGGSPMDQTKMREKQTFL